MSLLDEWNRCKQYIKPALAYANDSHTLEDVWLAIQNQKAAFFPLEKSAIVVEIVDYPKRSVCRIWLAGGDMDELVEAEKSICVWAKELGCTGMEIMGRKGWERQLSDYTASAVVLVKDL